MRKIFMRGLFTVAPVALTIALLAWLFGALESVFSIPIKHFYNGEYYFPGAGIVLAFILIFLSGIAINNWLMQRFYSLGEGVLKKIPLVKTLYSAIVDFMGFFRDDSSLKQGKVVSLEVLGVKMVGLLTREDFANLPGVGEEGEVAVFLPLSYQIGGMTVMVPASKITPIEMSVEEAMRFVVTAGMLSTPSKG